jgi:hypothetical protein
MAKAAISGGGGGSNGAAVTLYLDSLAERVNNRFRKPPPGAFSRTEFRQKYGMTQHSATNFLAELVANGELEMAELVHNGVKAWFYWPAKPCKK